MELFLMFAGIMGFVALVMALVLAIGANSAVDKVWREIWKQERGDEKFRAALLDFLGAEHLSDQIVKKKK